MSRRHRTSELEIGAALATVFLAAVIFALPALLAVWLWRAVFG